MVSDYWPSARSRMLAGHPAVSESQSRVHEKSATDRESALTGNYMGVHFTSPSPGQREQRMEALDCSCPHPPSEPASFNPVGCTAGAGRWQPRSLIWDTCPQELRSSLAPYSWGYYRTLSGLLCPTYSISQPCGECSPCYCPGRRV